jgi:hypothetical protein
LKQEIFKLEEDIDLNQQVFDDRDIDMDVVLAPLFEPKEFNILFGPLTLDSFRLDLS